MCDIFVSCGTRTPRDTLRFAAGTRVRVSRIFCGLAGCRVDRPEGGLYRGGGRGTPVISIHPGFAGALDDRLNVIYYGLAGRRVDRPEGGLYRGGGRGNAGTLDTFFAVLKTLGVRGKITLVTCLPAVGWASPVAGRKLITCNSHYGHLDTPRLRRCTR